MRRRVPVPGAVALALLCALAPAHAAEKRCDRCSDLPMLEQQLLQQEWLQHAFREYDGRDPLGAYVGSPETMVRNITKRFNEWLNSPAGGGGASTGRAEMGTDASTKACALVVYQYDAEGNLKGKTPFDENRFRQTECKEINDFVIAHERQHQKVCRDKWAKGEQKDYQSGDFWAADDAMAYGAGIKVLRQTIAQLAAECGWKGSTNRTRPDRSKDPQDVSTVPTPSEIDALKDNVKKKANAVRRRSR